jgi:hypothetical protein
MNKIDTAIHDFIAEWKNFKILVSNLIKDYLEYGLLTPPNLQDETQKQKWNERRNSHQKKVLQHLLLLPPLAYILLFTFLGEEVWGLWYSAMFCPSKLQHRISSTTSVEESNNVRANTSFSFLLTTRHNYKFSIQFLLVVICLSLPLTMESLIRGQPQHLLLLLLVLPTAYCVSFSCTALALNVPLLFSLVYVANPSYYITEVIQAVNLQLLPLWYILKSFYPIIYAISNSVWLLSGFLFIVIISSETVILGIVSIIGCSIAYSLIFVVAKLMIIGIINLFTSPPLFFLSLGLVAVSLSSVSQGLILIIITLILSIFSIKYLTGGISILIISKLLQIILIKKKKSVLSCPYLTLAG